MLHTKLLVAVVRLALAAVLGAVIVSLFPSEPSPTAATRLETRSSQSRIEMYAIPTRAIQPAPPRGRAGNVERLRWGLRDRHGNAIGVGIFSCRWHRTYERLCSGELRMPLGKLAVMGSSETRSFGVWAVVGGTGRYADVGGEMRFVATGIRVLTLNVSL